MRIIIFLTITGLFSFARLFAVAQTYDVTSFGAVGDGRTDNTAAIQRAIDSCSRTGGDVYFPRGVFMTATLLLKSEVTLVLSPQATLLADTDIARYPRLDAGIPFYGEEWATQALIFCRGAVNVGIRGSGTIDGRGASFPVKTHKKPDRYRNRPYLLWFAGCRKVLIRDVHLRNSAFWMQHYLGCDDVNIEGVNIWNHSNKNNDMMDVDGCRNVRISGVNGDSDDDGITIKSTSPLISENITITGCILSSHCNALKFGTESTGGFRNVVVSNCVIRPSRSSTLIYGRKEGMGGIAMEIADGGVMENISISNIVIDGPQVPIFIRLGNRGRRYRKDAPAPGPGSIRNISLSDIIATGADETGCSITGIPGHPVQDVTLRNITLQTKGSDTAIDWHKPVPELEGDYPEGTMFGVLPAFGFFIRHAHHISLSGLTIRTSAHDTRPGIFLEDCEDFSVRAADIRSRGKGPLVCVKNSRNGLLSLEEAGRLRGRMLVKEGTNQHIVLRRR